MCDLPVHKREGKLISEEAVFIKSSDVCYVTSERTKGDYLIILTTSDSDFVAYGKNVDSYVVLIAKLENFIKIDRSSVVNLAYDFDYNKDLGHLIYKDVSHKSNNSVVVARKYEKSLKEELIKLGKWE